MSLRPKDVALDLEAVKNVLGKHGMLRSDAATVLDVAKMVLEHRHPKLRRGQNHVLWKLKIEPSNPLRFVEARVKRYSLEVDLFCDLVQHAGVPSFLEGSLVVRVWSREPKLVYRSGLDADDIRRIIDRGESRVITRFHFERANIGQEGPRYHLQMGGTPEAAENCWYPKALTVPRFIHHPVNLVLACDFVVATFFPEKHPTITEEPTWLAAVHRAEDAYLQTYFKNIWHWLNQEENRRGKSLLKELWNR